MSSITNNSAYYQLGSLSTGSGGAGNAQASNSTTSLLQAMNSADSASSSSGSDAYLLDLSPAAQQYLNGGASASSSANPLNPTGGSFTLTTQQQQAITTILQKYKDAPYTQATFDSIQNDLNNAGLGTSQLSMEDQAQNFNPTTLLVDDLDGNTAAADAMVGTDSTDEQAKSSSYMQQIIAQWQQISGNTGGSAVTAAAGSAGA